MNNFISKIGYLANVFLISNRIQMCGSFTDKFCKHISRGILDNADTGETYAILDQN